MQACTASASDSPRDNDAFAAATHTRRSASVLFVATAGGASTVQGTQRVCNAGNANDSRLRTCARACAFATLRKKPRIVGSYTTSVARSRIRTPLPNVHLDVPSLYAAIDSRRRARGLSWRSVADETSLAPSLFTRMSRGDVRPDSDGLLSLCHWLKSDAATFAISCEPAPFSSPITFNPSGLSQSCVEALSLLASCAEKVAAADRTTKQ